MCRVLVAPPEDAPQRLDGCPRCSAPLTPLGLRRGGVIYVCMCCRGLFAPPRAWTEIGDDPQLGHDIEARFSAPRAERSSFVPLLSCPVCRREMERASFCATSSIVVDVCMQHGIWLDAGELVPALAYAEHRAAVGPERASDEADEQWARAHGRTRMREVIELEEARIKAESAQRTWKAKRGAMVVTAMLVVLRLAWSAVNARSHREPQPAELEPPPITAHR